MKNLTFKQQFYISMSITIFCFILATWLKIGFIHNIGWVLFGLAFVIHPVCPEAWKWRYGKDEQRMNRDFRLAGIVVILIGLLTKYGI